MLWWRKYLPTIQRVVFPALTIILVLSEPSSAEKDIVRGYHTEIKPYVDFLQKTRENPVDYILRLFDEYDLVVLCERAHPEMTQYDFFFELAVDKRFLERVGNIFTEIGSSNYGDRLNRYLEDSGGPESESIAGLNEIYRDFYSRGVWDKTNLYVFLKKIREANSSLDPYHRIHVYPSDKAFSYDEMTKERYQQYDALCRDSAIAANIINMFSELKKSDLEAKALIIMNFRHGVNRHLRRPSGQLIRNVGGYLFDAYPGRVANIMLNAVIAEQVADTMNFSAIQAGRWDAAFAACGNPAIGFDLAQSPFGSDRCDYINFLNQDLTYQDLFTGYVFYNPVEAHRMEFGIPAIFEGDFENTLNQRIKNLFDVDSTYVAQYVLFAKEHHEMTYNTMEQHFEIKSSHSIIDQEIARWLDD